MIKHLLRLQCIAAMPRTDPVDLGTEPYPGCCLPASLPEAAADLSETLNACPDPTPPKQGGEFELFKQQIRVNPKCLGCSSLGKRHTIGTAWRREEAESWGGASSEGRSSPSARSESKSRPASWSSKPSFCRLLRVYAPISPLKSRQKQSSSPTAPCKQGHGGRAAAAVMLSQRRWERLETRSWFPNSSPSASGCGTACVICSQSFRQARGSRSC